MNLLDWAVISLYLAGVVGIAAWFSGRQHSVRDYYLAGYQVRWWQSGFSTMATQLGAISFVSAPAFVALKEGGGLKWLCYEFGVPLGLLVVMAFLLPVFHRGRYLSIYEYLERRFDRATRSLVSALFQLGRGLATAVSVLAGGLILSTALSIPTATAILLIGAVTILYDVLGGIRVVVLSDVLQMMIILVGILVCGGTALSRVGWEAAWAAFPPQRAQILDFAHWGVTPAGEYAFWPMLLGGIFLYASYYGCDQSQMQRELSVGSLSGARRSLLVNAFGRFPVVLLYCLMGVFVGAVFMEPEAIARVASAIGASPEAVVRTLQEDPDRMLPMFILTFLPHGVIGFLLVAIMAALMSSLDSALNSLSAVTVHDFYRRYVRPQASDKHYLAVSKICTLLWGLFCVAAALLFAGFPEATRQTTLVLINAVGSLLYGPILAAFLLGVLSRWATARAVKTGVVAGIAVNLILWQASSLSWLWWNVTGFLATAAVAGFVSGLQGARAGGTAESYAEAPLAPAVTRGVLVFFLGMVGVCFLIQRWV